MCVHQLPSGDGQFSGSVLDPFNSVRVCWAAAGLFHDSLELFSGLLGPGGQLKYILKQRAKDLLVSSEWFAFCMCVCALEADGHAILVQFSVFSFTTSACRHGGSSPHFKERSWRLRCGDSLEIPRRLAGQFETMDNTTA